MGGGIIAVTIWKRGDSCRRPSYGISRNSISVNEPLPYVLASSGGLCNKRICPHRRCENMILSELTFI